ncbi:hypothetical protein NN561_005652 [Cricetulus griseus]
MGAQAEGGPPKPYISNLSAHTPADPLPSSGDLIPGIAPPTPKTGARFPTHGSSRSAPSTCGEDAESEERLADHVTPALGTELDTAREEFSGADQGHRAPAAPLPPGRLREEGTVLTAWRDLSRQLRWQLWCPAALGEAEVRRRVSCVPCGARRTPAPSQLREPRARLHCRQTPPTGPPARTGPPTGLPPP